MARVDNPMLRGTLLGHALRLWNPFMRRLLRSPLHWPWSRWFALIEWRGRRSGRTYSTPVSHLADDDDVLITTGDRWSRNLVGGAPVSVWVRGRRRQGIAEAVLDERESLALHQHMFTTRPVFARLAGISGAGDTDEILRSIRAGRTLVRVRLTGQSRPRAR